MHPIPTSGIHIPLRIRMQPIRQPRITIRKQLTVLQPLPVGRDAIPVDTRRVRRISHPGVRSKPRIGDVNKLPVRTELDAVDCDEAVRHRLHDPRARLEPVDLLPEIGYRAEALPEGVVGVGEPEVAGERVLDDVVGGGEVAAEEVVEERSAGVGGGVDLDELGRAGEGALVAEDDGLVGGAVWWGARRIVGACAVGLGELVEVQGGDGDGGVGVAADVDGGHVDGVCLDVVGPVAGGVQLAGFDVVDAGLVEGSPGGFGHEFLGEVRAEDVTDEGVLVCDEVDPIGWRLDGRFKLADIAEVGRQLQVVDVGEVHHCGQR